MPPRFATLVVLASLLALPSAALSQSARHTTVACPDCLASLPAGNDPAPLLVVLHGDGETARSVFDAWEPAAAKRGIVVFAPTCPRAEGCTSQSWWKWNGDPSWLQRQMGALGERRSFDRSQMWIAGWSGGGTYLGWYTQTFERDFAALVIHGGGVRPARQTCSSPRAGIYFLGGDRNPLHALAEQLHTFYAETCPHEDLTWTVLAGVDHDGERRALGSYREGILDWLATRRRAASASDRLEAGVPSAPPSTPDSASIAPLAPPSAAPTPRASCGCSAGPAEAWTSGIPGLLAVLALGLRRRQGGRRSTPSTR